MASSQPSCQRQKSISRFFKKQERLPQEKKPQPVSSSEHEVIIIGDEDDESDMTRKCLSTTLPQKIPADYTIHHSERFKCSDHDDNGIPSPSAEKAGAAQTLHDDVVATRMDTPKCEEGFEIISGIVPRAASNKEDGGADLCDASDVRQAKSLSHGSANSENEPAPSENENETTLAAPASEFDNAQPVINLFSNFAFGNKPRAEGPLTKRKDLLRVNEIKTKKQKKTANKLVPMKDLPKQEYDKVIRKWHSLLSTDQSATVEDLRFEMLVATLLHARCQEITVRRAIQQLRIHLGLAVLKVDVLAGVEPADITEAISCLQFYATKAKYIVMSSRQVRDQFGGIVPDDLIDLRKLFGIGDMFADLLNHTNATSKYLSELPN